MIQALSKAQALIDVKSKAKLFKVPELLVFDSQTFVSSPDEVISEIESKFDNKLLAIRSSASDEDGFNNARAGEYESVLNVRSDSSIYIQEAITKVIESYKRETNNSFKDEFIVQEMLTNTSMSGVVFTHDLNTGAPYYVINYDDVSGLTDTVTSGGGEYSNRTLYIHRGATSSVRSKRFQKILPAILEIEEILSSQFLDIEFALGEDLTPYLLQVRSITTHKIKNIKFDKQIDSVLHGIQQLVRERLKRMPGVYGDTTVLGQMPDWNPAEMIGRAPRALAFSLYRTLITDHVWSDAREIMGYKIPDEKPLMLSLAGQPFIDTRLSFHSYLPDELSSDISEKLVNTWVERLRSNPELHDKVEFDVAITTYSFDIDDKLESLIGDTLNKKELYEFKESLRRLTYKLLNESNKGSITSALDKIEKLSIKHSENIKTLDNKTDIFLLKEMINDCISLGTTPFSILARHGFIARTILLSLQKRGIFSEEDVNLIQFGVRTVASELVFDMHKVETGGLLKDEFMSKYGHLRPGTYDILSLRYDQMSDLLGNKQQVNQDNKVDEFILDDRKKSMIDKLLQEEGFDYLTSDNLLNYINQAIIGREYGKFVFTRSISEMLELIAGFSKEHNLSRDEISHVPVEAIIHAIDNLDKKEISTYLKELSDKESENHRISVAIRLPQVLFDEEGVHVIPFQVSHPNFITHKKVTAIPIRLNYGQSSSALAGKIVIIENADPGFDWIFSQKIAGLITKYGGANSHMAIRCAEFGIPAAIGCGEQRFDALTNTRQLLLDCAAGLINPLH
jgi:glutamine kinase